MATDDGSNFSYTNGQAAWNPALRPNSTEPQEVSDLDWGTSENQDFDLGVSPAVTAPTVDASVNATSVQLDAQSQTDDLSALWQAALEDDDLLVETNNDGWAAFDDGEGFLDDATENISNSAPITNNQASGVTDVADATISKPNRYAPSDTQNSVTGPTNSFLSERPQFTDFSQLNQPTAGDEVPTTSSYHMAYVQQPSQRSVPPTSTESFVDKSKGGYHSPYDLPEDLAKPRKRLIHHAPSMPTLQSMQPPPRSTSLPKSPAIGPPRVPPPPHSMASRDLTPPSSSHSSQSPNDISTSKTTSPTKPADRRGSSEFFADLPEVRRTRHPAPAGRYTPMSSTVQTPPVNQSSPTIGHPVAPPVTVRSQPLETSLASQLRSPERMPLYGDDQQSMTRAATMPLPPPSSRYSPSVPAVATVTKSRYSPAPTAAPTTTTTRYSPAPTVGTSHQSYAPQVSGPTKIQNQPYAPRTSSPLAFSSSPQKQQPTQSLPTETGEPAMAAQESVVHGRIGIDRATVTTGHVTLEPVSEDGPFIPTPPSQVEAPTMPTGSVTPPLSGQRSGPPSAVSSPRKRMNYVPQQSSTGPTSDPGFAPPPRSHTSSPGKVLKQPQLRMMSVDRPASAHSQLPGSKDFTTSTFIQAPPRRPSVSNDTNFIPPQGEIANDPLKRWKGSPIFKWSNGGIIVSCFPQHVPRYGSTFLGPAIQPTQGKVKTRSVKDVFPQSDLFVRFPGPLKKGKKKDVLTWLKTVIEELESQIQTFDIQSGLPQADIRMEEKILLWKFVSLLVEHDGILEGKPVVEEAVRKLLNVATPVDDALGTGLLNANKIPTDLSDNLDPSSLSTLRDHLYHGDREKAVWHAADQRLWAHALLIASTLPREIWKQVVQEFVRKEIRKAGEPIAALYQVFAGNWEESIDELVPVSARAGFQMISAHGNETPKDALAGLDKWRETLLLVLNNRSPSDVQALLSLGRLLRGYGRIEAAHICFLFARSVTYFGGEDDPQVDFTLLGSNPFTQGSDLGRDLDSVLLSEVYEFALTLSPTPTGPIPHLQSYKLYHAEVLTEMGYRNEAQQYCDAIASTIHSKTKPSAYFNVFLMQRLDDLSKRLFQAPLDGSSWKPSMDKVSSSFWGKFNSFVTGEDSDAASNTSATGQGGDSGNFIRMRGDTPNLSRQTSNTDLYSAMMSHGNVPMAAPNTSVNTRYVPGNASPPRTSFEKSSNSRYAPQTQVGYQSRTSLESTRSAYEPRPASGNSSGLSISPKQTASYSAPISQSAYVPPLETSTTSAPPIIPNDTTFSQSPYTPSSYQPTLPAESVEEPSAKSIEQSLVSQQPLLQDTQGSNYVSQQPVTLNSYEPPSSTYEPHIQSSYEPPSYQTYEPSAPTEESLAESSVDDSTSKPKKSFMDDDDEDDDELMKRAEALKKEKRAEADRIADEAFRKAVEADATKAPASTEKKGWFGGWFKKDSNAPTGPIKAKLGEENSFVFDKELGKWVNKKAGATSTTPMVSTPPPPKPSPRPQSASGAPNGAPPPMSALAPGDATSRAGVQPAMTLRAASVPPPTMVRSDSQMSNGSAPAPSASVSKPPMSGPPTRPVTTMGNSSDLDDLLGAATAVPRKGGRKGTQRKGRYVDIMASQK